jgi:inner membrane protein
MSTQIGNFFRSPSFKFMIIGILSLLLLIPASMIRELIRERESRNEEARKEISESWSDAQTLTGPYLSIPSGVLEKGGRKDEIFKDTYHILPEQLKVDGTVNPIEKNRGIFTAVVYDSRITLTGFFNLADAPVSVASIKESKSQQLYLCIGLSDLRGIGNGSSIMLNGKPFEMMPGVHNRDLTETGIHVPLQVTEFANMEEVEFSIVLDLKGSSELFITPIGKTTDVQLASTWPDPSFTGNFLPADKKIGPDGFEATWGVNYLNRNYPQGWYDDAYAVDESAFGVHFLVPVDHYQKSERSVKYAFMFIALSFLVFFLTEIILKTRIHPIQYLLVGFALIVFYTLLVSLSEQIGFNLAYLVSTLATTILVGFYMRSGTASGKVGLISGALLLALYGFLFTTLQLQELSLLMGSIGLFIILAVIMMVSRKINWYREESQQN